MELQLLAQLGIGVDCRLIRVLILWTLIRPEFHSKLCPVQRAARWILSQSHCLQEPQHPLGHRLFCKTSWIARRLPCRFWIFSKNNEMVEAWGPKNQSGTPFIGKQLVRSPSHSGLECKMIQHAFYRLKACVPHQLPTNKDVTSSIMIGRRMSLERPWREARIPTNHSWIVFSKVFTVAAHSSPSKVENVSSESHEQSIHMTERLRILIFCGPSNIAYPSS